MKVRYRLVFCRKGVFSGDGRALVQVEASGDGRKRYFSSNIYLSASQWDSRRKMVVNHPNSEGLNAYLLEMVISLERIELDLWKRGISPTLELIKENYFAGKQEISFKDFVEGVVEDSVRCLSTKKNLLSTLGCLHRFVPGVSWVDFSHQFVQRFELWLTRNGYARNTVIKHLRNLRTFINEAIAAGYIPQERNPFRSFRISQNKSPHKFLSPDELFHLEGLNIEEIASGSQLCRLRHVRDAFLFCCYTGLRFSDFCRLRSNLFIMERSCMWLRMKLQKTGVEVNIPLGLLFNGKAVEIIGKYSSIESFARVGSNSKVNSCLKVLQHAAGIRTRITFHVA